MLHHRIREKRHRLPEAAYQGKITAAFTAVVVQRNALFTDPDIVRTFQKILLNELSAHCCSSPVFVFMPDHLHLLLSGNRDDSSVYRCMNMFKQKSGYWLARHRPLYRWQKDYYDHIIRSERDFQAQIRYILMNPVKAGLCRRWKEYPWKGSTVFDFSEWSDDIPP